MKLFSPGSSFRACGALGLLLGAPLSIWLALRSGLSPWIELALIAVAVGMLLGTPLAVKVLTGRDGFTFYRDVIPIFIAVTLTLRRLHQPLLPYLDVTIAGSALFLACGRIGCFTAGCCYGRPAGRGVRYQTVHAEMGFPWHLVGVRLFPIQAVESAWALLLAGFAALLIIRHSAPGSALAWCVSGYALGRFFIEFARGDAERPYWLGFSLPQWISLGLAAGISSGEVAGMLPYSRWGARVSVLLALEMLLVALIRRLATMERFEVLHPRHTNELARELHRLSLYFNSGPGAGTGPSLSSPITVSLTSRGVRISAGNLADASFHLRHYCVSRKGPPLSPRCAYLLARCIARLQHDSAPFELFAGHHGIVHVFFPRPKFKT